MEWHGKKFVRSTVGEQRRFRGVFRLEDFGENYRKVIASDIVPLSATRRHVREVLVVRSRIIIFQSTEEEVKEFGFCEERRILNIDSVWFYNFIKIF